MTQRIAINQIIEAAPARVVVSRDTTGTVAEATFDLTGLPRVDALLTGRQVIEVPRLVERLCGICPSAHHLAGIRALEALAGVGELPVSATTIRRLLHYAAVIAIHLVGMIATDRDEALELRRLAKLAMAVAGSPGHFPATAIIGGVAIEVDPETRDRCLELIPGALAAAERVVKRTLDMPIPPEGYNGADLALIDEAGNLDLFGHILRVVSTDGRPIIAAARASDWDSLIAEAVPGSPSPRPYLKALGAQAGTYRVGPVAQLRVGILTTPRAAAHQQAWRDRSGGATSARAIITLHGVEVIEALLNAPELTSGPSAVPWSGELPAGIGVGWVDGARGLLVHRYEIGEDGRVRAATILTPTAQNEPWLGDLLTTAATEVDQGRRRAQLEEAIHEADPCLPCSAAPAGAMDLVVDMVDQGKGGL
ncbi:MAG: nickel-dependent hydrogenase large subunit [Propionibacteriaceae bacterium]|jgi:NAD-reducing hydrogenase large subunit|nr:nickel-dependent hydrogenase large subunit [Propionibacteriaceae bacterium]